MKGTLAFLLCRLSKNGQGYKKRRKNNLRKPCGLKYLEENCAKYQHFHLVPPEWSFYRLHLNFTNSALQDPYFSALVKNPSHPVYITSCASTRNSPTASAAASKQTSISAYTISRALRFQNPASNSGASRNSRLPDRARRIRCTPNRKRGMKAIGRSTVTVMR